MLTAVKSRNEITFAKSIFGVIFMKYASELFFSDILKNDSYFHSYCQKNQSSRQ